MIIGRGLGGLILPPATSGTFASVYGMEIGAADGQIDFAVTSPIWRETGFAVAFWVRSMQAVFGSLFEEWRDTYNYWGLYTTPEGRIEFQAPGVRTYSQAVVGDGEWHHVVMVADPANDVYDIYIDGALDAHDTFDTHAPGANYAFTHVNLGGTGYAAVAAYDDLAVFDSLLTAQDIAAIYNGGTPTDLGGRTDLIGYWLCGDGASEAGGVWTIPDLSGNGYHGTSSGTVSRVELATYDPALPATETVYCADAYVSETDYSTYMDIQFMLEPDERVASVTNPGGFRLNSQPWGEAFVPESPNLTIRGPWYEGEAPGFDILEAGVVFARPWFEMGPAAGTLYF